MQTSLTRTNITVISATVADDALPRVLTEALAAQHGAHLSTPGVTYQHYHDGAGHHIALTIEHTVKARHAQALAQESISRQRDPARTLHNKIPAPPHWADPTPEVKEEWRQVFEESLHNKTLQERKEEIAAHILHREFCTNPDCKDPAHRAPTRAEVAAAELTRIAHVESNRPAHWAPTRAEVAALETIPPHWARELRDPDLDDYADGSK